MKNNKTEEKEYVSNCCSASMGDYYDYKICPSCGEHCEVVEIEEEE